MRRTICKISIADSTGSLKSGAIRERTDRCKHEFNGRQMVNVCFGSKAAICNAKRHVRFVPTADIVPLVRSEMTEAANQATKA